MMKCISLWQPWATAVAMRWKRYETRSWARAYRGPVAIHAAKQDGTSGLEIYNQAAMIFKMANQQAPVVHEFPRGAIVACAEIVEVRPAQEVARDLALVPSGMELLWGDFADGRYAWRLDNVRQLAEPIPFRASQGLFNLDAATERKVRRAAGLPQAVLL